MAFTAAQLLTVGEILELTPLEIETHFDVFPYDADTETYVETELEAWERARVDYVHVEPNVKNFGARIDPNIARATIRKNIALALGLDIQSSSGSRLVRA